MDTIYFFENQENSKRKVVYIENDLQEENEENEEN